MIWPFKTPQIRLPAPGDTDWVLMYSEPDASGQYTLNGNRFEPLLVQEVKDDWVSYAIGESTGNRMRVQLFLCCYKPTGKIAD